MQIKTPLKKTTRIAYKLKSLTFICFEIHESHKSYEPSLMNPLRRPSANGNGHNWMYKNNNETRKKKLLCVSKATKAEKLQCCSISN